jgi:hypothetical protein
VNTTERYGRAGTGPAMADAVLDDLEDLRSTITVSREHPSDVGQRQVFLRIDGGTRVALLFGESFTTDLEPGRHRLRVHNTLVWKTIDFAIERGERLEFIVINSARWWTAGMAGLLGAAPLFLRVQKRSLV